MISEVVLQNKIGELLATLYGKRIAALNKLKLSDLLNKNPYLYRALGASRSNEFIEQLLVARVSSSDETIFGNDFFEPLAIFAAQQAQLSKEKPANVSVGAGAGQDIAIESALEYLAIAVKSGTNIFNSQSEKGQSAEFQALQARMKKLGKMFRPIVGYGYGRKSEAKRASPVEKVAGQKFWELLTGESDFYLRISRCMETFATAHAGAFQQVLNTKQDALLREFMIDFVDDLGSINWDAIVTFNSGAEKPKSPRRKTSSINPV